MQKRFLEIWHEHIHRPGSEQMLSYLERSGFFDSPASSKFHGAYDGGLCEHSVNVYDRMMQLVSVVFPNANMRPSNETIAIVSLLHDSCKSGVYRRDFRNRKNEQTGQWEKVPFYQFDDPFPYGHGEKSVYIVSSFMKLTRDEAMAIRFHMGGFAPEVKGGDNSVSKAFEMCPLALLLHEADLLAAYLDEAR